MRTIKRKKRLFWLVGAAVLVVGAGLWVGIQKPFGLANAQGGAADSNGVELADGQQDPEADDAEKKIPVPVELARVQRRPIASFYRAASVIEADRLVDLVARVPGRVRTINAEEGDWVDEGEVIIELENDRERVQVRQAEINLEEQNRLLERNEAMLDQELISRQVYDDIKHAYDLAEADHDLARITLEETIIRAPFAGQITDRKVVLGQHVNVSSPLFTLADFQPLRVRVHLPENVARKVSEGQRVLVHPEALPEALDARVERVAPVVDPSTSTVRLTLILENGQNQAYVGGFVKVRITTESHLEALAIPKLALVEEGGLRSVFVAEADSVRKVEIHTGLYDETHVEVLDGVDDGDFIVTLGQGNLRTGSLIEPLNGDQVGWHKSEDGSSLLTAEAESTVALNPSK